MPIEAILCEVERLHDVSERLVVLAERQRRLLSSANPVPASGVEIVDPW